MQGMQRMQRRLSFLIPNLKKGTIILKSVQSYDFLVSFPYFISAK